MFKLLIRTRSPSKRGLGTDVEHVQWYSSTHVYMSRTCYDANTQSAHMNGTNVNG